MSKSHGEWYLTQNELDIIKVSLGALIGFLGAWMQRLWNKQDAVVKRADERKDIRDDRLVVACGHLLDLQAKTRTILQEQADDETIPAALHPIIEDLDRWSVFIADEAVRDRVENLAGMIWYADKMAPSIDGMSANRIAWNAANEIGWISGVLVRGEARDAPEWYSPWLAAYLALDKEADAPRVAPETGPPPANHVG